MVWFRAILTHLVPFGKDDISPSLSTISNNIVRTKHFTVTIRTPPVVDRAHGAIGPVLNSCHPFATTTTSTTTKKHNRYAAIHHRLSIPWSTVQVHSISSPPPHDNQAKRRQAPWPTAWGRGQSQLVAQGGPIGVDSSHPSCGIKPSTLPLCMSL
jgi:hypothetical protein